MTGRKKPRLVFITGTDTGVGKTTLTLSLTAFLRAQGLRVAALKPFSSGGRDDAIALMKQMDEGLSLDEVNPHFIDEPVAPGVHRKYRKSRLSLGAFVREIRRITRGFDVVLVEGIGGAMVPITGRWLVIDLIKALKCEALVVAKDQLGTLNHTLLTVFQLEQCSIPVTKVVLMKKKCSDLSENYNQQTLMHWLGNQRVVSFPFLGSEKKGRQEQTFLKKALANIWGVSIVCTRRCDTKQHGGKKS